MTLVNPTVITSCTQAALQAALAAGGHIAFDCDASSKIVIGGVERPTTFVSAAELRTTLTAVDVAVAGNPGERRRAKVA